MPTNSVRKCRPLNSFRRDFLVYLILNQNFAKNLLKTFLLGKTGTVNEPLPRLFLIFPFSLRKIIKLLC